MRNSGNYIIVLALVCLTIEACSQDPYSFLRKGVPSPYDSGVVIEIKTYRQIRKKITIGDSLIRTLEIENKKLTYISQAKDTALAVLVSTIGHQAKTIVADRNFKEQLNNNYNELYKEATRPKPWYERAGVIFLGGVISGIIIKSL